MQVSQVSNITFESKTPRRRFITPMMRTSIESILLKMNSDVRRVQEGDYFKSTINNKIFVLKLEKERLENVVKELEQGSK